ncbi:5388_t:CDS:2, partial [Racocetra fulgida]
RLNVRNDIEIEAQLEPLIKQLSERIGVLSDGSESNNVDKNDSNDKDEKNSISNITNLTDWTFVLVDGFLLYWDMQVVKELDIKLFVQADYAILKKRREERTGYVTVDDQSLTIDELVVLKSNCARDMHMNLEMVVENVLGFVKNNE